MTFIGIDIGTTFIKGALLDLDSYELRRPTRRPFPTAVAGLPARFYEVDPTELVATMRTFIIELVAQTANCQGIILCSQMHGLVLTDRGGTPLSNVITWRDERASTEHPSGTGSYFDLLLERITADEQRELGNCLRPGLPLCTLFWLQENNKLPAGTVIPKTLPDFVVDALCHNRTDSGIEPTNAAAHGTFNIETVDWHYPLLQKLELDQLAWPRLRPVQDIAGMMEIENKQIPIYMPVGDHQASLAGAFLRSDELSLNISTGSQVSLLKSTLQHGTHEIRPYFDNQFLHTFVKMPSGRALELLLQLLCELAQRQGTPIDDPWSLIAQATTEVDSSDLSVDLSFYASTIGNGEGRISNIHEENLTVGHLFRAAYQSMAESYYSHAQQLAYAGKIAGTDAMDTPWERLVFSGGVALKNSQLRQTIAERFGCSYRTSVTSEDALMGLMALALFVSGKASSVAEALQQLLER